MIERGTRFTITTVGAPVVFEVKTIRYAPVAYAEVEPVGGGVRIAVSLAKLERATIPPRVGLACPAGLLTNRRGRLHSCRRGNRQIVIPPR